MRKPILAVILIGILLATSLALVACGTMRDHPRFTPGVFIGVGEGLFGPVKTEVEFSRREVLNVRVIEHRESPSFYPIPIERIPRQIVEHQSLNVNIVSGATITSFAIISAVEDAVIQAGGNLAALRARNVVIPRSTEVVNMNVEFVVVGSGGAGMFAAIGAAEKNMGDVVLLELMPGIGGNTILAGWPSFANPTISAEYRPLATQLERDEVDRILFGPRPTNLAPENVARFEEWREIARQDYNRQMTSHPERVFDSLAFSIIMGGNPSAAAVTEAVGITKWLSWFNENGVRWQRPTARIRPGEWVAGGLWPRVSRPVQGTIAEAFYEVFHNQIRHGNLPLEIKLETPAIELIEEGGRVVGVIAEHVSGKRYNIRANYVILATGGFSANFDMIMYYAAHEWPELAANPNLLRTNNSPGARGDGIKLGLQVGARLNMMNAVNFHPGGEANSGLISVLIGISSSGPFVNKEGRRFTNENWTGSQGGGEGMHAGRNRATRDVWAQTDSMMWIISDRNNSMIDPVTGLNFFVNPVDHLIDRGKAFKADTIRELAVKIGINPDVLEQTINDFNAAVDAGLCTQVTPHRTAFPANAAVRTPPFYAIPNRPTSMNTEGGGLVRDPATWRVIRDSDGQPIEGLYAIGEVVYGGAGIVNAFGDGISLMGMMFPQR